VHDPNQLILELVGYNLFRPAKAWTDTSGAPQAEDLTIMTVRYLG
jgi:hypothetical protein